MMTLLELCCNQVAIRLWATRKPLTTNCDIDVYFWQTKASVLEKCDLLEICQNLIPVIKTKVKSYGEKIYVWTKFVLRRLKLFPFFVIDIYWTANGGEIDAIETYYKLIAPNVCGYMKFRVACELCMGEVAENIFLNRFNPPHRDVDCKQIGACTPLDNFHTPSVGNLFQLFWHDQIGASDSINNLIQERFNLFRLDDRMGNTKATLFAVAVASGNVRGVRYIWNELGPFERWLVIRSLPGVVTQVHIYFELKFIGYCRAELNRLDACEYMMFEFRIVPAEGNDATPHLMEGQVFTETRKPFELKALQFLEELNIIELTEVPVPYYEHLLL